MTKQNCWEFKKCERQPGGLKSKELGICPVTEDSYSNGINNGINAGRVCWAVSGSLCGGKVQGTFASKAGNCAKCDFFKTVRKEQGSDFCALNKSKKDIIEISQHLTGFNFTNCLNKINTNGKIWLFAAATSILIIIASIIKNYFLLPLTIEKEIFQRIFLDAGLNIAIIILVVFFILIPIIKSVTKPLDSFIEISNRLSKNDLSFDIAENNCKTETGEISRVLKIFVNNLNNLISSILTTILEISVEAEEMKKNIGQTAQGAEQTAASTTQLAEGAQNISRHVEEGAVNLNKMNKVIHEIFEEATNVAKLGNETETNANIGAESVKKAVNKIDNIKIVTGNIAESISELGKLSSEIEHIVVLIKNLAGQTNLLALNAAIEAARAGEHGKGFAVVADEVKKLAGQSTNATEKITSMIKEIQNKTHTAVSTMNNASQEVEEGVLITNKAGEALENIISQVKTANNKIQSITKEIDDFTQNSDEIVKMIENIAVVTEETAASSEEISSITEEQTANLLEINTNSQALTKVIENLSKQVAVFKI